ncbi:hypothetical protein D3C85_1771840 [compost metagenome]
MRTHQAGFKQQVELLLRALARHAHGFSDLRGGQRPSGERNGAQHLPACAAQAQRLHQLVAPLQQSAVRAENRECQVGECLDIGGKPGERGGAG